MHEWIFSGIGTELIVAIAGFIFGGGVGGFIGYKVGIKTHLKQVQKAGNNSKQKQQFDEEFTMMEESVAKVKSNIVQKQNGRDNVTQTQIGGRNNGRR